MFLQRLIVIHVGKTFHIETRYPHIHNYDDAEIGMYLFESCIQVFRTLVVLHSSQIIVHIGRVIASYAGYHGDSRHFLQLFELFRRSIDAFRCFPLIKPFRIMCLELQQQVVSNLPVWAYYHCFLYSVWVVGYGRYVMVMYINGKFFKTVRLAKNHL